MSIPSLAKISRDTLRFEQVYRLIQDKRAKLGDVDIIQESDIPEPIAKAYSAVVESVLVLAPVRAVGAFMDRYGNMDLYCKNGILPALYLFYTGKFRLTGMRMANELEGKKYDELSPVLQNRIDDCRIQIYQFYAEGRPEEEIKIFKESL